MSEFYDSREFEKLPDEFNRDYKEATPPVQKKKSLIALLTSFVAATMLIFPLTITGSEHHVHPGPDPWVDPDPYPTPPDVVTEYEITGQWQNDNEYFEFFEDGTGFWTDTDLFVLLNWEKSGNDYYVHGEGMYEISAKSISFGHFDMFTIYDNGQLYLQKHTGDNSYAMAYFSPSNREFDLTNIMPLFGIEGKDRFVGIWVHEESLNGPEDGMYVVLSYIQFMEDGRASLDFASVISDRWAGYELPYVFDIDYPNIRAIVGDGTRMYFEEFPAPNSTYTYESYELFAYRFIDINGEGLLVTGMNQTILRRFEWEEPSGN